MKANSNLLMRAAAMLLAVSACIALSACTKLPNSSNQPTPAPSPTATTEPSTTPSPSPKYVSTADMQVIPQPTPLPYEQGIVSYTEYFSQEREFPKQSVDISKELYLSWSEKIENNYLRIMDRRNYSCVIESNIKVYPGNSVVFVNGYIYAIQENRKIIKCDIDFKTIQVLYEHDNDITDLQTDGEAFFFIAHDVPFDQKSYETTTQDMSPKTVCRLHLPSGIVDEAYRDSTGVYILKAISNNKFVFSVFNEYYLDFVASEDYTIEKDIDKAMYARYSYEIKERLLTSISMEEYNNKYL